MKLRKNDMKISNWSILKTFIILLFLLDIATLMVTFKREEICVSDFSCSKLTSFNHSSVSLDKDWARVSTNISSVMTRKYYCLVKREKSFFGTLICEISPVFWSMGQKRKLWKPGLKKWLSSVFITWNCFKEKLISSILILWRDGLLGSAQSSVTKGV